MNDSLPLLLPPLPFSFLGYSINFRFIIHFAKTLRMMENIVAVYAYDHLSFSRGFFFLQRGLASS